MNAQYLYQKLLTSFKYEATEEQSLFLYKFSHFISSESKKNCFVLRGYAGTGKTSLIQAITTTFNQSKKKLMLMAPTGRAAKVMTKYSGKTAFTVHRIIYSSTDQDQFSFFTLNKNTAKNTLYIVDEASMIGTNINNFGDRDLLADLINFVYEGENCKLLFIGDVAQLPPVGSGLSPALIPLYLKNNFNLKIDGVELKTVQRQLEDSLILQNATELRNNLENENFEIELDVQEDSNFEVANSYELQDQIESDFSQYGIDETVILTKSNKRAFQYNQEIRHRIYDRTEIIEPGDLVMCVKNNYFFLPKNSPMGFIANGDILEVSRILGFEFTYGHHFADVILSFSDHPDVEFNAKILLTTLDSNSPSLPQQELKQIENGVKFDPNLSKSDKYPKVNPHLNALQIKFAYAVTCHKAQGGQWKSVYIDGGFNPPDTEINTDLMRWWYTAITRSSEKAKLLNAMPPIKIKEI